MASTEIMQTLLPSPCAAEGLTQSLLDEYLHNLEVRRGAVLHALYSEAALQYSCDVAQGVDAEVDSAVVGVPDRSLAKMAAEHQTLTQREAAVASEIASARIAADLQTRMAQLDADIAAGAYSTAAWSCRQVEKEAVQAAADATQDGSVTDDTIASLYSTFAVRQASLQQAMEEAAEQSCQGDAASGTLWVARRCSAAGVPPIEIYRALAAFTVRPARLAALARMLLHETLLPMVAEPPRGPPVVHEGDGCVTLTWRGVAERSEATLEQALLAVLAFASGEILGGDTEAVAEAGSTLWPRLAAAYLEARLSTVKPADGPAGEAFQTAAAAATAFEDEAARSGWVPGVGCGARTARGGRVHSYVKNALNHFLHAKRLRVVKEAQQLMTADVGHDSQCAGVPLPQDEAELATACSAFADVATRFQQHCCEDEVGSEAAAPAGAPGGDASGVITSSFVAASKTAFDDGDESCIDLYAGSGNAKDLNLVTAGVYQVGRRGAALVALVREVAEEVQAAASPAVAKLMASAVRDIAALAARASSAEEEERLQVPVMSALRHNDAWHLSLALVSSRDDFHIAAPMPADSGDSSSMAGLVAADGSLGLDFANEASLLRGVASGILSDMIRCQDAALSDILSQAHGFTQVHLPARRITASKVVAQLLASLRRGVAVLGGVLPPAAHVSLAAALLQRLCLRIIGAVLAMRDIGVEESEQLPQILHTLVDDAPAAAIGRKPQHKEALEQAVRDATPALLQLQVLLEVLNARLADIRDWWQTGALQMRGFQAEQTAHLIRALFDPTELRAHVLAEIEQ